MRKFLLILHRWPGLSLGLALVVTGVTGAILPYQRELSHWLAPDIWRVEPPAPTATPIPGLDLVRRVEALTGGRVSYIPLSPRPDHAQALFVSPPPGAGPLGYDEVFVDPYRGRRAGQS